MTVYEELADWLNTLLDRIGMGQFYVDLEFLQTDSIRGIQPSALMNNPNDTCKVLVGGTRQHTKYKTMYFRRDFNTNLDRVSNELFFEKLAEIIYSADIDYKLPANTEGRTWKHVKVDSQAYPSQRDENGDTAVYQITLKIIYDEQYMD